ncbi:MAG: putative rane protein [Herbinix sp.]|jgi:hypothetical protein|nr:putative rane protein [Herbinix sp.]
MSSFQRVIKYCAIAFAIMLTIGIVSGIAHAAFALVSVVSGDTFSREDRNTIDFNETYADVKSLDIENATGDFKIKIGETFKIEAQDVSESFDAKVDGNGELTIRESKNRGNFFWFNFGGFDSINSKVTLYLPANFVAEEAKIDSGAGSVTIDSLKTDYLFISAGAGNINGRDMTAEEVKIDGGVGNVNLNEVNFNDADFDCGVGNLNIDGILVGNNKIDCGVGEVDLSLKGNIDDYDLDIDSGVGTIRVNGEKISESDRRNNSAANSIKVDGGVGNVKIDIKE